MKQSMQCFKSGVCEALVKALNLARTEHAKGRVAWAITSCLQMENHLPGVQSAFVDNGVCGALVGALKSTHGMEHVNHIVNALQALNDEEFHEHLVNAKEFDEDVLQRWQQGAMVGQIRIGIDGISCSGLSGCNQQ
jgi:hypothetical protein